MKCQRSNQGKLHAIASQEGTSTIKEIYDIVFKDDLIHGLQWKNNSSSSKKNGMRKC